jgi:hypothetical protein
MVWRCGTEKWMSEFEVVNLFDLQPEVKGVEQYPLNSNDIELNVGVNLSCS